MRKALEKQTRTVEVAAEKQAKRLKMKQKKTNKEFTNPKHIRTTKIKINQQFILKTLLTAEARDELKKRTRNQ